MCETCTHLHKETEQLHCPFEIDDQKCKKDLAQDYDPMWYSEPIITLGQFWSVAMNPELM